jgi:DNA-directed RNA polymerase specialized sigma24 family protein
MTLEDLAILAKQAAIKASDGSLDEKARDKASLEKQIALTKLFSELTVKINQLPKPQTDASNYVYEEALQDTYLYICKNIHNYDPARGSIIGWLLFILKKRKINSFNSINWDIMSIYTYTGDGNEVNIYDIHISPELNPLPSEKLLAFIKEDPEGLLQHELFNRNPNASFQTILLKKIEEDKSWEEIAQEFKIGATHGPIYCFYQRSCKKFAPYFNQYLYE